MRRLLTPLIFLTTTLAEQGPFNVTCKVVQIPGLHEFVTKYRSARICAPVHTGLFPIHLFAHGNGGGGAFYDFAYKSLQEQLASFGFVVPAYLSCWFDSECSNGEFSFLQALKTLEYLEQNPQAAPVDLSKPYSASGHSTGARAVLMLAAVRDNPSYLRKTSVASQITTSMRASLSKLKSVVADHPDPMYNPKQDPDIQNFKVNQTAVLVITGTLDWTPGRDVQMLSSQGKTLEPKVSAWKDFQMLITRDKVFVNMLRATHLEPNHKHIEGPFICYFSQYFALGSTSAGQKIYGHGKGSIRATLPLAQKGDLNDGDGKVAFLACSHDGTAVPQEYAKYCQVRAVEEAATVLV